MWMHKAARTTQSVEGLWGVKTAAVFNYIGVR